MLSCLWFLILLPALVLCWRHDLRRARTNFDARNALRRRNKLPALPESERPDWFDVLTE